MKLLTIGTYQLDNFNLFYVNQSQESPFYLVEDYIRESRGYRFWGSIPKGQNGALYCCHSAIICPSVCPFTF